MSGSRNTSNASAPALSIHRLLDEAFATVTMTPEMLDLKEEIRGNLSDRAAELESRGMSRGQAAATAFGELGDLGEVLGDASHIDASNGDSGNTNVAGVADSDGTTGRGAEARASLGGREFGSGSGVRGTGSGTPGTGTGARPGTAPSAGAGPNAAAAFRLNHVRPKPAFVVRTVILSLLLACAIVLVVFAAVGAEWMTAALSTASITIATIAVAVIVADSLRQTTTQHYPVPRRRALGYAASAAALFLGILLGVIFVGHAGAIALLVSAVLLAAIGIAGCVWLGTTQTNRTKPWVQAIREEAAFEDRFSQDPAAAARFGIYTVVIWVLAGALFVILSLTVGFLWSWLALLGGLAVFMFTLARMLFGDH